MSDHIAERMQHIQQATDEKYGLGARFLYPDPKTRELLVMTLADAMVFCGPMIAREDDEALWHSLDTWRDRAVKLEQINPDEYHRSMGRAGIKLEAWAERGNS